MYKIKILPLAHKDWEDASNYLEEKRPGFGLKFSTEVVKRIEELKPFPKHKVVFGNIRCINLKKFKYRIHFTVNDTNKVIRIIAFFHISLDPKVWRARK